MDQFSNTTYDFDCIKRTKTTPEDFGQGKDLKAEAKEEEFSVESTILVSNQE